MRKLLVALVAGLFLVVCFTPTLTQANVDKVKDNKKKQKPKKQHAAKTKPKRRLKPQRRLKQRKTKTVKCPVQRPPRCQRGQRYQRYPYKNHGRFCFALKCVSGGGGKLQKRIKAAKQGAIKAKQKRAKQRKAKQRAAKANPQKFAKRGAIKRQQRAKLQKSSKQRKAKAAKICPRPSVPRCKKGYLLHRISYRFKNTACYRYECRRRP